MAFNIQNTQPVLPFQFGLSVEKGLVEDFSSAGQFGYNTAISSTFETVWGVGGTPTYPSTATGCTVTSSNTASDDTGTEDNPATFSDRHDGFLPAYHTGFLCQYCPPGGWPQG